MKFRFIPIGSSVARHTIRIHRLIVVVPVFRTETVGILTKCQKKLESADDSSYEVTIWMSSRNAWWRRYMWWRRNCVTQPSVSWGFWLNRLVRCAYTTFWPRDPCRVSPSHIDTFAIACPTRQTRPGHRGIYFITTFDIDTHGVVQDRCLSPSTCTCVWSSSHTNRSHCVRRTSHSL